MSTTTLPRTVVGPSGPTPAGCPSWCLLGLCTVAADPVAGVHRSGEFSLAVGDFTATAALWAVPASEDNPEPSTYVTLLDRHAPMGEVLNLPADRRRERRLVRTRLRNDLNTMTTQVRRAA